MRGYDLGLGMTVTGNGVYVLTRLECHNIGQVST
jgi:hypothetical protein